MIHRYEHLSGGILFVIEHALFKGKTPWHATRTGREESLATGRFPEEVLEALIKSGIAAEHRLPLELHNWNGKER